MQASTGNLKRAFFTNKSMLNIECTPSQNNWINVTIREAIAPQKFKGGKNIYVKINLDEASLIVEGLEVFRLYGANGFLSFAAAAQPPKNNQQSNGLSFFHKGQSSNTIINLSCHQNNNPQGNLTLHFTKIGAQGAQGDNKVSIGMALLPMFKYSLELCLRSFITSIYSTARASDQYVEENAPQESYGANSPAPNNYNTSQQPPQGGYPQQQPAAGYSQPLVGYPQGQGFPQQGDGNQGAGYPQQPGQGYPQGGNDYNY